MLTLVDTNGSKVWATKIKGPIRDIGVSPGKPILLAAGHGPANLTCFDIAGENLWTTEIKRDLSPWPWWELPTPAAVQVAGGISDEEPFFAVGCGDLQLRCMDKKGQELWSTRHYGGVPGRVIVADIDGSGKHRIIEGGEILSCTSTCNIFEPDGKSIAELTVEGWTSMLTALTLGESQGRHYMNGETMDGNNAG
jgi:hypothetical protein